MITERDLLDAIGECENEPPSFTSIKKLASLYTVYDHLYGTPHEEKFARNIKHSEFLQTVNGKDIGAVLDIMDELMQTLSVLYPKAYNNILRKIERIK